MSGGSGSTNSVAKTELLPPWATDVELPEYLSRMEKYSIAEYVPYTGKTYADQDETFSWTDGNGTHTITHTHETDGIKAIAARGRDSHPLLTKGETLLRDVIDGLKVNANTKIDDAYLRKAEAIVTYFEEDTLPRLAQRMNLSNNFGSIAHHVLMAKAAEEVMAKLSDLGVDTYFKDYLLEKSYQVDAVTTAPAYAEAEITNAEIQIKAGEFQREYKQGKLIDDWRLWTDYQQGLIRKLEIAGNSIRSVLGAQSREVVPYYRPSEMSQVAGLALAGLGIWGMVKSAPKTVGSGSTQPDTGTYDPHYLPQTKVP